MYVMLGERNLCARSVLYSACSLHKGFVNEAVDECSIGEEAPLGAFCC